ncbi:MAG: hypothetical protein WB441_13910, partial [Nocardioidaceae bacterium]
ALRAGSRGTIAVGTAGLVAVAAVATLALYGVPVWLVVVVPLVAGVGFTLWWLVAGSPVPLAPAGLLLGAAVAVSLHAPWLTAAALVVALVPAVTVLLREREPVAVATAGVAVAAALAALMWTVGELRAADPPWTALTGLLVLGVLVPGARRLPAGLVVAPAPGRAGVDIAAALTAVLLAESGLAAAAGQGAGWSASWAAVYLTVAGASASATALLDRERRQLGWVGGLLLAAATWVRLWEEGVRAPEAYTLPSALALLGVGLLRLRHDQDAATSVTLAPGLGLALVPSLLWALEEPAGLRALLLGLACLVLVLGGSRLGWTAPIAAGAVVGTLLIGWLALPYVGATVPRWVLLGLAGAVLLGTGATWERRLQEARQLRSYVRTLR